MIDGHSGRTMNQDPDQSRAIGLSILGSNQVEPWGLPDPGPSTLAVALGGEQPPSREELSRFLLERSSAEESVRELDEQLAGPPFALWSMPVAIGSHPIPAVVWVEQVQDPEGLPPVAAQARWLLAVQTILDPQQPLDTWTRMAGLLVDASTEPLALLDEETEQWFGPEELSLHFRGDAPTIHEEMLFRVDAFALESPPEHADSIWLHTRGLHRCGCPELELLELPGERMSTAHELLNAVGAMLVARGTPGPGEPFEIGPPARLMLQDWTRCTEFLSDGSVGGRRHRETLGGSRDNPLLVARAVLCSPELAGTFRKIHVWPRETMDSIDSGESALERTPSWTRHRSAIARSLWPRFLELHRSGSSLLACIAMELLPGSREHVWVRVLEAGEDSLSGVTLSDHPSGSLPGGSRVDLDRLDTLVDWFCPEQDSSSGGAR